MGYLDEEGIYHPQHGERGWGDEMSANLTRLGKGTFKPARNFMLYNLNDAAGLTMKRWHEANPPVVTDVTTIGVNGDYYFFDYGSDVTGAIDPGWLVTTSHVDPWFETTWPAGIVFKLPEGVFLYYWQVATDTDPVAGKDWRMNFDYAEDPYNAGTEIEASYFASMQLIPTLSADKSQFPRFPLSSGWVVADHDDTYCMPALYTNPGSANNAKVTGVSLVLVKVA